MKIFLPAPTIASLIVSVRELDARLSPGGLYAADRDLLFTKVIFPALKRQGFRISFGQGGEYAYVAKKDQKTGHRIRLISVSKIKVREFGGRHALDSHVSHDSRWDEKKVEREISRLWSAAHKDESLLLVLIGYGRRAEPLKVEIEALKQAVPWDTHGVHMESSSWADPHARGFHTCLCVWTKTEEANQSPGPTASNDRGAS